MDQAAKRQNSHDPSYSNSPHMFHSCNRSKWNPS